MKKLPAFQFYPGDWMKDPNLRRCSHAAKGVWVDMLCLMWESEERGVLVTAGRAWTDEEVCWAVGGDSAVALAGLAELTLKGVVNRRSDGAIYSKRMVRDEHKRTLCRDAGKRGGNPILTSTLKGSLNPTLKRKSKGALTPSSSSSSSSSDIICADAPQPRFRKPLVEELREWFEAHGLPEEQAEAFRDHHEARGWKLGREIMKDWQAACRTWMRNYHKFGKATPQAKQGTLTDAEILKNAIG